MLIVLPVEIGKRVESIQVQDNGERRMTEYTHLVEETRRQQAFREWKNKPTSLHLNNGKMETKYQDGRTEIEDTSTGKKTYDFPEGYEGEPYRENLFHRFLSFFTG